MIDTVKIYTEIDKVTYLDVYNKSIIKSSINKKDGELLYEIVNDHLDGSYSSKLSVRVGCGVKYGFVDKGYYIEIEGSYHKILKGFNSHDGIYNLQYIVNGFLELCENTYNIKLPSIENWFLQRVDIAKCFDILNQGNVTSYINSLSNCRYPRRKPRFFTNESLYIGGTTTTLKIYNKYLEFRKHDINKFYNTDFNVENYIDNIQGFIRFEIEIKKKMLQKKFGNNLKHIQVIDVNYSELEKIWSDEFMILLGIIDKDMKIIKNKEDIKDRLIYLYGKLKGMRLFNFYSAIQLNGIDFVKQDTSSSAYYRNLKDLKEARVDYTQNYKIEAINSFWFNPFEFEEVV